MELYQWLILFPQYKYSLCEESELFSSLMESESLEDCTKHHSHLRPENHHKQYSPSFGVTTASVNSTWICKDLWKVRQTVLIQWKMFVSQQVKMLAKISGLFYIFFVYFNQN